MMEEHDILYSRSEEQRNDKQTEAMFGKNMSMGKIYQVISEVFRLILIRNEEQQVLRTVLSKRNLKNIKLEQREKLLDETTCKEEQRITKETELLRSIGGIKFTEEIHIKYLRKMCRKMLLLFPENRILYFKERATSNNHVNQVMCENQPLSITLDEQNQPISNPFSLTILNDQSSNSKTTQNVKSVNKSSNIQKKLSLPQRILNCYFTKSLQTNSSLDLKEILLFCIENSREGIQNELSKHWVDIEQYMFYTQHPADLKNHKNKNKTSNSNNHIHNQSLNQVFKIYKDCSKGSQNSQSSQNSQTMQNINSQNTIDSKPFGNHLDKDNPPNHFSSSDTKLDKNDKNEKTDLEVSEHIFKVLCSHNKEIIKFIRKYQIHCEKVKNSHGKILEEEVKVKVRKKNSVIEDKSKTKKGAKNNKENVCGKEKKKNFDSRRNSEKTRKKEEETKLPFLNIPGSGSSEKSKGGKRKSEGIKDSFSIAEKLLKSEKTLQMLKKVLKKKGKEEKKEKTHGHIPHMPAINSGSVITSSKDKKSKKITIETICNIVDRHETMGGEHKHSIRTKGKPPHSSLAPHAHHHHKGQTQTHQPLSPHSPHPAHATRAAHPTQPQPLISSQSSISSLHPLPHSLNNSSLLNQTHTTAFHTHIQGSPQHGHITHTTHTNTQKHTNNPYFNTTQSFYNPQIHRKPFELLYNRFKHVQNVYDPSLSEKELQILCELHEYFMQKQLQRARNKLKVLSATVLIQRRFRAYLKTKMFYAACKIQVFFRRFLLPQAVRVVLNKINCSFRIAKLKRWLRLVIKIRREKKDLFWKDRFDECEFNDTEMQRILLIQSWIRRLLTRSMCKQAYKKYDKNWRLKKMMRRRDKELNRRRGERRFLVSFENHILQTFLVIEMEKRSLKRYIGEERDRFKEIWRKYEKRLEKESFSVSSKHMKNWVCQRNNFGVSYWLNFSTMKEQIEHPGQTHFRVNRSLLKKQAIKQFENQILSACERQNQLETSKKFKINELYHFFKTNKISRLSLLK